METSGLNHLIMTIKDVNISRIFYGDLLGFELETLADGFFLRAGVVTIFFFPSSHPIPGDRFNEFRIGLDHLSFTAPSETALQSLAQRLLAASVETKGVETYHTGNKYVAFRDPDNIQLEYWLPK
jgi:catechol 2,3-dioxygenase-like lactoylglutathione lyase family enzyme